ncbi:MAG TPA: hypothetical protein VMF05_10625 [Stellaceae bacterium]|nr:hypothetical protein [Stellaceae bacterium]
MYRMDDPTSSGTAPTPGTANPEGFPTAGNAATGVPATIPGAWWFHQMTEELRNIVVAVALVPTKNIVNQVLQAILRMCGGNVTTVATAGTTALTPDNAGLVLVNAAGGNVALTLPAVASAGGIKLTFQFVRTDSSANSVTLAPAGTDTISPGQASLSIPALGTIKLDGNGSAAWQIVGQQGTHGIEVFTESGTFVAPAGVTQVAYEVWGAGGAGGGSSAADDAGSAGGGGAYARGIADVTPGESYPVTVGIGGAFGNGGGSPTNGTGGTSSSFASFASCTGGGPGLAGNGTIQRTFGTGGTATGGSIQLEGQSGNIGVVISGNLMITPVGGGTFAGPAGAPGIAAGAATGPIGIYPGVGGGGGINGGAGAPGANGLVIISW